MDDSADHHYAGCDASTAKEVTRTRSNAPERAAPDFDLDEYIYGMSKDMMRPSRLPKEPDLDREPECPWEFPLEPNYPSLSEPDYPDYGPG